MGEMRGVDNFAEDARRIGQLVGAGPAGEALGQRLAQRMRMVAADVPPHARPRGLYLGVIGNGLYGGANRTSYHDVLEAGGVRDAAEHLDSWPELTPEQVLEIDPDVVVVHENTARLFCQRDGLRTLRACRGEASARVVELPSGLLNDPGLGMLPCAERLRAIVHGVPPTFHDSDPTIE
jgi:ABC-type Fe3+-hydroxamate transport system substrate-binding protein